MDEHRARLPPVLAAMPVLCAYTWSAVYLPEGVEVIPRDRTYEICGHGHSWHAAADKGGKTVCIGHYQSNFQTDTSPNSLGDNRTPRRIDTPRRMGEPVRNLQLLIRR